MRRPQLRAGVFEDSENDVNEPVVVPSAKPVYASKELSGGGCGRQWTSGGISRFPIEIWILLYIGYCVLGAGKLCPAAVSLAGLFVSV